MKVSMTTKEGTEIDENEKNKSVQQAKKQKIISLLH